MKNTYSVKSVPARQTYEWILKRHYAHRIPSISYSFGLYDIEKVIRGICTFGKPVSNDLCENVCGKRFKDKVYELNRLFCEINERNVLSYFVSQCLKQLPNDLIIVSYADKGMSHVGYIYQATNFIYTGETKERTDISSEGHSRHYNKNIDYSKNRKFRSAKFRYVYLLNKKAKLNYPVLPYPKGEIKRYKADKEVQRQEILF